MIGGRKPCVKFLSSLVWIFKTNQLTSDKQFENEKTVAGLYFEKIELPFTILGLYGFKT